MYTGRTGQAGLTSRTTRAASSQRHSSIGFRHSAAITAVRRPIAAYTSAGFPASSYPTAMRPSNSPRQTQLLSVMPSGWSTSSRSSRAIGRSVTRSTTRCR
jgi:hypothetical protein